MSTSTIDEAVSTSLYVIFAAIVVYGIPKIYGACTKLATGVRVGQHIMHAIVQSAADRPTDQSAAINTMLLNSGEISSARQRKLRRAKAANDLQIDDVKELLKMYHQLVPSTWDSQIGPTPNEDGNQLPSLSSLSLAPTDVESTEWASDFPPPPISMILGGRAPIDAAR